MWICPNGHTPDAFVVFGSFGSEALESIGVLIDPWHNFTNRYADGTVGVLEIDRAEVIDAEDAQCSVCWESARWEAT